MIETDKPKELIMQETVTEYLVFQNIFPASVLFCADAPASIPNLCITMYSSIDLKDFLKLINYDNLCDGTSIEIFDKTNTVILCGMTLSIFLDNIWESSKKM